MTCRAWLVLAAAVFLSACAAAPGPGQLTGVWTGQHGPWQLTFTFRDDGTCVLSTSDPASGTTTEVRGTFEVDFSKRPILLSVRNIAELTHPLYTVVAFGPADRLTMAPFAPRWRLRPVSFDPARSMHLTRATAPLTFAASN